MVSCEICNRQFNSIFNMSYHVLVHGISLKDYYDKYIRKLGEGSCHCCGKEAVFISLVNGYRKYCSRSCFHKRSIKSKKEISNSMKTIWAGRSVACKKEIAEKISKSVSIMLKKKWKDPKFAEKRLKAMFGGSDMKPNKAELKLQSLLVECIPGEFKFVGDGKVFINRKCPDFINVNGKKQIIELFGDYYHQGGKKEEKERIKVFKPYGYETLIIREKELKNEIKLKQRLKKFVKY